MYVTCGLAIRMVRSEQDIVEIVESDPNTSIECGWDKETWKSIAFTISLAQLTSSCNNKKNVLSSFKKKMNRLNNNNNNEWMNEGTSC